MNADKHYDLIISGGGMVGLALAAAGQQLGLRCAVIEQRAVTITQRQADEFSTRVSAINLASERLLTRLGAWQQIPDIRKSAYRDMHVWDGLGNSQIDFSAQDAQVSHLGHIVENDQITEALWQVILEQTTIDVFTNDQITRWQQHEDFIALTTDQGRQLRGSVLAGCEGKHSIVRQLSELEQWQWDYQHTALVATLYHQRPHQETARQVFLESGPLAFLPLTCSTPGRYASSIVWSAKTPVAVALQALNDSDFLTQLQQASEGHYGDLLKITPRTAFALTASQTKRYFRGRAVVLGDAAHTIHPLAGLGVNLGFLDAAALAEALASAKTQQQDCGHPYVLRRYQRQRQSHNLAVAGLMEGLKRLYDSQTAMPVLLRNQALSALNHSSLLKRPLIRGALGDFGTPLPTLCQPDSPDDHV